MEERRRFIRFNFLLKISCVSNTKEGYYSGFTKDVSREGIRVMFKDIFLNPGTDIMLEIYLPLEHIRSYIFGEVVWCKKIEEYYEAGIKLKDMNKEIKSRILEYAYNKWYEENLKRFEQ